MGMRPEGALIYGYALGGTETGWLIKELTEEGDWDVSWAPGDGDYGDVLDAVERKLATEVIGFTEPDPHPNAYYNPGPNSPEWDAHIAWLRRRNDVIEKHPIKIIPHGYEFSEHALVTFEVSAEWGEVTPVDLSALEARRVAEDWDALLAKTIKVLDITPVTVDDNNRWDPDASRVPVPPRWMVVAKYS